MKNTILHILSANGHGNLVSTICMKDSSLLMAHNVRNETPFHQAARFGHKNTISELIRCTKSAFGEDGLTELLRKKNCLGETALHEAARHGHGAVISTLMEEDLELAGLVNDDSVSPLYLATARGSLDMVHNMVMKMLDHQITPAFYSGPKELTALHAAVLLQNQGMEDTIIHILSANGHGINLVATICTKDSSLLKAHNVRKETPFHHAARFGHINTISELIRCAKSAFGEDGLTELLRKKNCLGETALHEAARHGHGAVVSTLMEEDLELAGLVNDDSVSPLYLATARGSLDMVKNMVAKMLNHEITPDFYSGPEKQTALHAAVLQDIGT
ncbi:Ankyrin repeat-containing protein [Carex littledalei]|uniref:Ankyrin repeat-containing protein n=1 Tax=Carex littledalei TaxID=544730 RepID=A0A833VSR4_9POAL|nr:Ankyrin repeat-containing protein [Carex littledalei]